MLKYKITLNEPRGFDEIYVKDLYLSPDLSFMSGITDSSNDLIDGQTVMVELNENGVFKECIINITEVIRKGYVEYDKKYDMIKIEDKFGFRYSDGVFYFSDDDMSVNINGLIYYANKDDNEKYSVIVPTKYFVEDDYITIGKSIYKVSYEYKKDNDGNIIDDDVSPHITLKNNEQLFVKNYKKNEWETVRKFIIYKNNDIKLNVDKIRCTKKVPYFLFDSSIDLTNGVIKNSGKERHYFSYNEKHIGVVQDDVKKSKDFVKTSKVIDKINKNSYKLFYLDENINKAINFTYGEEDSLVPNNELTCNINYEYRNSLDGNLITLYIDNTEAPIQTGKKIIAEMISQKDIRYPLNDDNIKIGEEIKTTHYIVYGGVKYEESEDTVDFVDINGTLYEVEYSNIVKNIMESYSAETKVKNDEIVNSTYGYIVQDEVLFAVEIKDDEPNKAYIYNTLSIESNNSEISRTTLKTDLIKKHYVTIDSKKYFIEDNIYEIFDENNEKLTINEKYVILPLKEKYIFNIDEIRSNQLICHLVTNDLTQSKNACWVVTHNFREYNFYLENNLFEKNNVSPEDKYNEIQMGYGSDDIRLYNPCSYATIPLSISTELSNNINQDDIANKYFTETEKEKMINPIVDMERVIYVPSFLQNGGDETNKPKLSLVNEIKFNLHFRTRNNEWKIVDGNINSDDANEIVEKNSWNIFDSYNYTNVNANNEFPTVSNDIYGDLAYSQPSDLLCFLNFTDDDVFYQKSKLGKSFLRLLFFNSNDPMTQSLLYSSTIFVNEGSLYKKYIDSIYLQKGKYASVTSTPNDVDGYTMKISNNISVNNEFIDNDFDGSIDYSMFSDNKKPKMELSFPDPNKRLDIGFTVNNRYECTESSEGFYLYIYKEYCERLHEEPIYMKVEFNHAGEGRTINFMMPFNKDENGGYHLVDLSPDSADLEEFKKGYPLSEIIEHMYIPLESVYDFEHKRYCYYMPHWMTHNDEGKIIINNNDKSMLFNLYEVKIKDESEEINDNKNENIKKKNIFGASEV